MMMKGRGFSLIAVKSVENHPPTAVLRTVKITMSNPFPGILRADHSAGLGLLREANDGHDHYRSTAVLY